MRAITYSRYGPPDVLRLTAVIRPEPKDDEILIRVRAAEATKSDCEMRSFTYSVKWFWLPLRIALGVRKPRRQILGGYFSGEIESLGKDVSTFSVGDHVFGTAGLRLGAYGEYVALPARYTIVAKPNNMSFAEAAAVPLGGLNALHFMRRAKIRAGERVLINGAGGSIGAHAVQIAKSMGAEITAVDSTIKEGLLRRLGADHFVDYTKEDFAGRGQTYDLIFDMVPGSSYTACIEALSPNGRYLSGNPRLSVMLRSPLTTRFTSKTATFAFAGETSEELLALKEMIEGGTIGSIVDRVFPMEQAADAHRLVETEQRLAARGESRSYEGSTQSIRRTTLTRMARGTRETDQPPLWIATSDLPTSPGHPFYARLTTLLDGHHVDRFVEGLCDRFYAPVMGRPSLAPGRYFRLRLVGSFEGIDSERGMAWRATDSLAVRRFLRVAVDEAPPDHSTIARTRRLIDLETHRTVFTWVQQRLVEAGRLTGKTIAIDATTLEANAAMRSIVRRDTGESDQAFLAGLATASGVETPTREGLARLDRKRKKKTSNTDWTHPHDPDATVTKMKDGRTHLAHKAEQAVDMETGAIVAVTRQGADVGDTTTIIETAIAATEQVEDAQANVDDRQSLEEIVGEKGYHSNQTLIDLDAGGIRSYVSEPDRGRRDWSKDPEARAPVYGNRRRMRGRRGRRLMRQRGERIERSFAHLYDTGGMRRTHLRGHTNILKRLLIHAGGFNLGLVMRHLIGIGPPRGLQGRVAAVLATLGGLMGVVRRRLTTISSSHRLIPAVRGRLASLATFAVNSSAAITCTTGC